ncbi:unnamed protein product [Ranitomeya imitator]|uniref:ribonuclease H n=1 Tax=Ranitomeya imitator TaxID=111125 RepID=A0ABN9L8R7_9NEOB|nr:unnamed protein product [Ranitomeya imitator]
MAALMAILRVRGLVLFPYLDDILIKAPSFAQAHESLSIVLDSLSRFGWLVNRKKSCLIPSQRIIFLGMLFDTRQSRVFLPKDKRSTLCRDILLLQGPRPPSLRSAMKVLGRMVATLEAIPFAQFHSRPLQQAILSQWDRSVFSLDRPIRLSFRVKRSLNWWLTSPLISQGRSFLPVHWQVVTTDASLIGWGAVFRHLTVQGRWSLQESALPINVLEIRAIFLSLRHWERILRGLPVRIQTDNATAVAYVNHQGGDSELLGPCRGVQDPPLGRGNGSGDIRGAYPRRRKLGRRLPQPRGSRGRGMVPASGGLPSDLSSMGNSGCGSHGVSDQQEGSTIRLQVTRSSRSGRRCSGHSLVTVRAALSVPTPSITSQTVEEDQSGRGAGHPDRPGLAQESLVRGARQPSRGRSLVPSRQARSAVPGSDLPPEFSVAQFNGVAVETAVLRASGLSDRVIHTMIQARKPSSSRIYYRTWKAYFRWCESNRNEIVSRMESLEKRFKGLENEQKFLKHGETSPKAVGGLSRDEVVQVFRDLSTSKEAALTEDILQESAARTRIELTAVKQEQQRSHQDIQQKINHMSQDIEGQILQLRTEVKNSPQATREIFANDFGKLETKLLSLQQELENVKKTQAELSLQMDTVPGQIRGVKDEVQSLFPTWLQRSIEKENGGSASLSDLFLRRDELEEYLVDLERKILSGITADRNLWASQAHVNIDRELQESGLSGVSREGWRRIFITVMSGNGDRSVEEEAAEPGKQGPHSARSSVNLLSSVKSTERQCEFANPGVLCEMPSVLHAQTQAYFVCLVEGRAKYCSTQAPGRASVKTRRGHHPMKIEGPGLDRDANRSGTAPGNPQVKSAGEIRTKNTGNPR